MLFCIAAGGPSSNPGLCYIWEDEIARQKNKGRTLEDLLPPDSPPREHVESSQSELFFKDILKKKLKNLVYYILISYSITCIYKKVFLLKTVC